MPADGQEGPALLDAGARTQLLRRNALRASGCPQDLSPTAPDVIHDTPTGDPD
ncbi:MULTISPECIES: hypothetical protein [unclassified Kitasatospora]|uniref:hypothetical protein n=1 Tax=unclassified Kitasatospora TaxID=2633591 RepID=UPI00247554B8|nr:hypothetical protein [Kitasatospora sp. MAP12-44]